MFAAFACSSGLHLLAALLLGILLAKALLAGHQARETIRTAAEDRPRPSLIALERRPLQAPAALEPARSEPAAKAAAAPTPGAALATSQRHSEHRRALLATVPAHHAGAEPKALVAASGVAAATAPEPAAPAPAAAQHEDAQPSPSPAPTQLSDVPAGGWGQNFANPLLADESALDDLRAKYHGSASVQVDETGRAVKVVIGGALSSDARAEIEKRLMGLRYVPAECNGLRCSGTLQLAF